MAEAPFLEAVCRYRDLGVLGFNVPGHLQGRGASPALRDVVGLAGDITQVWGMDDIHRPHGVTAEAQRLAAEAYGADQTWFLVNGTTSGVHAMLLAALRPGDTVLVPRNAHRSVMGGLVLAEARPVYYLPPFDPVMGVHAAAGPEDVEPFLDAHPEARAVLFTHPTYYGAAANVRGLVALAHERGVLALADEAWGPHLAFHPDLPLSAVAAGADLVVQSSHKLLAALSQASMLHLVGERVNRARLESVLKLLLTTSPSTLLVASLDAARAQMVREGRSLLDGVLELARYARQHLPGVFLTDDPTRLVFARAGYTGYELERILREEANLQLEMVDRRRAVAQLTWGHTLADVERLVAAVQALPARLPVPERRGHFPLPPLRLTPRQAFDADREAIPLEASLGRVSAETIGVYPPGIPLICAGEEITAEVLTELVAEREAGAPLQGGQDPYLRAIHDVTPT